VGRQEIEDELESIKQRIRWIDDRIDNAMSENDQVRLATLIDERTAADCRRQELAELLGGV
jgi:hypothetical protein